MSTFSQLNLAPAIAKALDACGYKIPTPIQAASIPEILKGKDLVASAQTGTGKTASFVLPSLHQLSLGGSGRKPQVLILTPTRELATQVTEAARKYGKFLKFNIVSLLGGMSYRQQLRDLSRPVDMVVATPGRLLDHLENKRLDLSEVKILVLDEADRMLDMGFIDDVKAIANMTPKQRQTLLFSATVDGRLESAIKQLLKNPVRVNLSPEKMAPIQIEQALYRVDNPEHKNRILLHLLKNQNIFKGIIFCATKIGADKLASQLERQGYAATALHGDLKQSLRRRTIEQLKRGEIQFLVATDVAARGLDISDMTHVINYDMPKFCEDYVHRIGRTGRAGKKGIAISFALPYDHRHVLRIEKYTKQTLKISVIEGLEPSLKPDSVSRPPKKRFGRGGSHHSKGEHQHKHKPRRNDSHHKKPHRDESSWKKSKPARFNRESNREESRQEKPHWNKSKPARFNRESNRDDSRQEKPHWKKSKPARFNRDEPRQEKSDWKKSKPARFNREFKRDESRQEKPHWKKSKPSGFNRDSNPHKMGQKPQRKKKHKA